jgi:predicted Zn-dependent protease
LHIESNKLRKYFVYYLYVNQINISQMKKIIFLCLLAVGFIFSFDSCTKDHGLDISAMLDLFGVQQDSALGLQMKEQILNSKDYKILPRAQYPDAYANIDRIKNTILATGMFTHEKDFPWEVYIIQNDTIQNAFACPGGYLYVYTGIIKYLDNEAQLAGVIAHEMAHAERRHSTKQLLENEGLSWVTQLMLGQDSTSVMSVVAGYATGLSSLYFSRNDESEADNYAVQYLYKTTYNAPSLGDFFAKIEQEGGSQPLVFLSTHPSSETRLQDINAEWQKLGGKTGELYADRYALFKASLPK